jgi:positive regulator of sigma E activity
MSELIGMVLERKGERARVRINHKLSTQEYKGSFVDVWNSISAKVGENVILEQREFDPKKAKFMVYGLVPLCLLAGLAFGNALTVFFALVDWKKYAVILLMVAIWGSIGRYYIKQLQRDVLKYGQQLAIVNQWYPKPEEKPEDDKDKEKAGKKD